MRSEVKVKVTPKLYILSSKDASTHHNWDSPSNNVGDMARKHKRNSLTDGRTDGRQESSKPIVP